ncbi:hypothetical protein PsYK624_144440 [Phanerochaete sordida]|uniref:C2H2-type domain-containing protein n=1 Tax=Phanerochaete sordida TaxID=48140 RepID=A0A9P3GRM6_9APHY|nr:hypothetical protein PsYK624_144440 [Phanerochaete sordida]
MSVVQSENPAVASLLSLSMAAAEAAPIPVPQTPASTALSLPSSDSYTGSSHAGPGSFGSNGHSTTTSKVHSAMKHRRLSSTGQSKRRMSEAREAASRPSPQTLQSASAALNALATLSLGSPPPQAAPQTSTSFASAVGVIHLEAASGLPEHAIKQEEEEQPTSISPAPSGELSGGGISIKNGKKRGTIFKCESCSKVYRHPSCLIKHRWEHSPHWREASKLMLSKHQQVQLLEAAAILSHMSPSKTNGQSLPEDRSLWPSFLSNGLLPPPTTANGVQPALLPGGVPSSLDSHPSRMSSSVPAHSALSMSRPGSTGPRMHDYSIPTSSGITHVRPGVVGVSTGSSPAPGTPSSTGPAPIPVKMDTYREPRALSVSSDTWNSSPVSSAYGQSYASAGSWSLPRSSLRSRSTSAPKTDEDEGFIEVDIEGDDAFAGQRYGFVSRGRTSAERGAAGLKDDGDGAALLGLRGERIEEEWDGEMEMEM